eukprot:TRINITY_DN24454_c0_g1_i2.p1 TRINITY_DN24454_c0_g1~~TRINITY_DN24454_c0_g1_i2.p1  ORF type:complete len:410 (-),score=88.90 TRINITY_DN24454_c0_g1_i2:506-1708(-)
MSETCCAAILKTHYWGQLWASASKRLEKVAAVEETTSESTLDAEELEKDLASHPEQEASSSCTYRVKSESAPAFTLVAEPEEVVRDFCGRLWRKVQLSASPSEMRLTVSFRDPQHGGTCVLDTADSQSYVCSVVPDRTVLNARVSDEGKLLQALRSEGNMLLWEQLRLSKEARGLHRLLAALKKDSAPSSRIDTDAEADKAYLLAEVSLERLRQWIADRRQQNARLLQELAGLEVLVTRLTSKGGDDTGKLERRWRGDLVRGQVHHAPPDGSCLFHSLSCGLQNATADELRREVCDFIEVNPDAKLSDKTLKDWILWESGQSVVEYAAGMRAQDKWAGPIEMAVLSLLRKVQVNVYMAVAGEDGFQLICALDEAGKAAAGVVSVVFSPGHYDALEVHRTA